MNKKQLDKELRRILQKCIDIKDKKGIDVGFEYTPYVGWISIKIYGQKGELKIENLYIDKKSACYDENKFKEINERLDKIFTYGLEEI